MRTIYNQASTSIVVDGNQIYDLFEPSRTPLTAAKSPKRKALTARASTLPPIRALPFSSH